MPYAPCSSSMYDIDCDALKGPTLKYINTTKTKETQQLPSPRCFPDAKPVQCMMSRLAWEHCASSWKMSGLSQKLRTCPKRAKENIFTLHQISLMAFGAASMDAGDTEGAKEHLKKLKRLKSTHPLTKELEKRIDQDDKRRKLHEL